MFPVDHKLWSTVLPVSRLEKKIISPNLLDTLGVFWTFHWTHHVRQFTVVQNHKKPQNVPEATQNTRRILMHRNIWCFVGHLSNT